MNIICNDLLKTPPNHIKTNISNDVMNLNICLMDEKGTQRFSDDIVTLSFRLNKSKTKRFFQLRSKVIRFSTQFPLAEN